MVKSYAKNKVKDKARKVVKKQLKKLLTHLAPYIAPVVAIILVALLLVASLQSFFGSGDTSYNLKKSNNDILNSYINDQTIKTNDENTFTEDDALIGYLADYYGIDKNLAITPGIVKSYFKYMEMSSMKNTSENTDEATLLAEDYIKVNTFLEILKPRFVYTNGNIHSERHYQEITHDFEIKPGMPNGIDSKKIHVYSTQPRSFSASDYTTDEQIYILDQDKTYEVANKSNATASTENGLPYSVRAANNGNAVEIVNRLPSDFDSNYYSVYNAGDIIYVNDSDQTIRMVSDGGFVDKVVSEGKPNILSNIIIKDNASQIGSYSNYSDNQQIYCVENNKTYTISNKSIIGFSSFGGKPSVFNNINIYAEQPSGYSANNYNYGQINFVISTNSTYTDYKKIENKIEKKDKSAYFLKTALTYRGHFEATYSTITVKYTNANGEEVDETKPMIQSFKQTDKVYEPLKNILFAANPNEDVNDAIAMIVNTQSNLDAGTADMKWVTSKTDDFSKDPGENSNSSGGTFYGGGTNFSGDAKAFVDKISKAATEAYKQYGVFASITIAQAIEESGYGKDRLPKLCNNLFGIKGGGNWTGAYVTLPTAEQSPDGTIYYVVAAFRAYNSWDDSINDHTNFLVDNSRYRQNGVFSATTYIEQAQALQRAGYATKLTYGQDLIALIQQYGLNQYDVK